jgi:hypothetical protein
MTLAPAPPSRDLNRPEPARNDIVPAAGVIASLPPGVASAIGLEALVVALCRQFSQATGWRLEFLPENADPPAVASCWDADLGDGQKSLGILRLHTPRVETNCSFVQATEMAAGLVQTLQALAESHRRLASRTE